jgi:hypothetical protein
MHSGHIESLTMPGISEEAAYASHKNRAPNVAIWLDFALHLQRSF